jgi:hypothetical protein
MDECPRAMSWRTNEYAKVWNFDATLAQIALQNGYAALRQVVPGDMKMLFTAALKQTSYRLVGWGETIIVSLAVGGGFALGKYWFHAHFGRHIDILPRQLHANKIWRALLTESLTSTSSLTTPRCFSIG